MNIIEKVKESLTLESYSTKLGKVLKKNPGFKDLSNYAAILSGKKVASVKEDPSIISNFKCCSDENKP